jgi:hypothetical protein
MPETIITTSALAKHGIIAFFGAIAHALNAHRAGKTKNLIDIAILVIISSFSGIMFALIAFSFFDKDSYLTLAMAGAGGFLGVEGLTVLVNAIKKSLLANMK